MKFIWQQILAVLGVLFVALAIIAASMDSYMTDRIQETRRNQLMHYGRNIVTNDFSREDLYRASQLLVSENILIQVYLPNGQSIYPTYDQRFNADLSEEDLARLNSNEVIGFRTSESFDASGNPVQYLTVYLPHDDVGNFPDGFISLGAPLDDLEYQLSIMRQQIYGSFIIAMVIGISLSVIYTYFQTSKIRRLQQATREISKGHFDVDLNTQGRDEFADLARDFKSMAHSLQASYEEIHRQEALRQQFMMDVAHEMRTPLTTMSGILEGLSNNILPEKHRARSLELLSKETARLTRLVNENLDYEKVQKGQLTLNKKSISGQQALANIQRQLQVKAADHNNQIVTDVGPDVVYYADPDRFTQILINLVTNAIQFSHDSEIILTGAMTDRGAQVQVIDSGIGMTSDQQKKIFERFYKADPSRKNTRFGESGIGLSLVASLVEVHGGQIEVESELGRGSTFTVTLPHEEDV